MFIHKAAKPNDKALEKGEQIPSSSFAGLINYLINF